MLAVLLAGLFALIAVGNTWTPKLGLDLRGGTTITLTAENTTGTGAIDPNSLELARTIIQSRVDSLGVGESEVTTAGDRQLIVTVPNVQRDQLVELVGQDRPAPLPGRVRRRTGHPAAAPEPTRRRRSRARRRANPPRPRPTRARRPT